MGWATFWAIFLTNSSGHPGLCLWMIEEHEPKTLLYVFQTVDLVMTKESLYAACLQAQQEAGS
jgi:hypothetical protein